MAAYLSPYPEGGIALPEAEFLNELDVPFTFHRRPSPLPADLRPDWRVSLLTLILSKCWGNRASLKQLHVLNWAIRSPMTRNAFLEFLKGSKQPDLPVVRFEPSLDRALSFGVGEKLMETADGVSFALTEKGGSLAERILKTEEWFAPEKQFLAQVPGKLSQRQIENILEIETQR